MIPRPVSETQPADAGNPWIARNLFHAFERAKHNAVERMTDFDASQIALPWMPAIVGRVAGRFFSDGEYWPSGIARNRAKLEAFLKFCFEQNVTRRRLAPEDLFVEQAHEPVPRIGL